MVACWAWIRSLCEGFPRLKVETNAEDAEEERRGRGEKRQRQGQTQVPFGNDNKKSKSNGSGNCKMRGSFAVLSMTAKNKQRLTFSQAASEALSGT
jgi:hypothetical protein